MCCVYGTCWVLDWVWQGFGRVGEPRGAAGTWFCNVLGLCGGSFLEGRERLSIQGFHLCITAVVRCLLPPSCTGIRAPPADVALFTAALGTRCGMAMGLLGSERELPMSPPILPLHPPPSVEHPSMGRCCVPLRMG